ncbi:hypothetical protein LINGRAHAP2_LOCUS1866 [Linum grandiflorum]
MFNFNHKINYVSFVHCSPAFLYSLIALLLVPAYGVRRSFRRSDGGKSEDTALGRRAGCNGESRSTALGRRTDCVGESWTSSAISNRGVSDFRAAVLNGGVGDFRRKIRRFSNPTCWFLLCFS